MKTPLPTVIQDHGLYDNIQRVIFGYGLKFWLHRLLFLDSLSYLSHGQLSLSLERSILVDVDDIFVGEVGTRMKLDDVEAMLSAQERYYIPTNHRNVVKSIITGLSLWCQDLNSI